MLIVVAHAHAQDDGPAALYRSGFEAFLPYNINNVRQLDTTRIVGAYRWNGLPVLGQVRDPSPGVQRFDTLTGLSALEAGHIVPGGVTERVDKLPAEPRYAAAEAAWYTHLRGYGALDLGYDAPRLGLRANGSAEQGEPERPGLKVANRYGGVTLVGRPTSAVDLTASYEYQRFKERGVQASFFLDGRSVPRAPRARTLLGQTWDGPNTTQEDASVRAAWRLAPGWSVSAAWLRLEQRWYEAGFDGGLRPDGTFEARYLADPALRDVSETRHAEIDGAFTTGPLRHRVRAGYSDTALRSDRTGVEVALLGESRLAAPRRFAPVNVGPFGPSRLAQQADNDWWFVSDAVSIGRRLTLFGTYQSGRYRQTGANVVEPADERYDLKSVGVRYALSGTLTVYASRGEALELGGTAPLAAANAERVLPSYISRQVEAGVRWLPSPRLSLEAAVFEARKGYEYEDAAREFRQDGTQFHRAAELKAVGAAYGVQVYASLLLLDPTIRGALDPSVEGKRPVNVPERSGRLIVEAPIPGAPRWSASASLLASGPRYVTADNAASMPGYAVWGAGVRYERPDWLGGVVMRVDVDNLFNRGYWLEAPFGVLYNGEPRGVFARVSVRL